MYIICYTLFYNINNNKIITNATSIVYKYWYMNSNVSIYQ